MADVGLVIKEEYVVVPSQQQGSAFQNSCTCSLPKSVEAPEKNHARDHPGRQIFSCKLWSLGCSLGTSFKCIFNVIWYTSIVKLFPILNYPWRFCLIAVFKSSFCILRLLYSLAVGSADQLILSEATSEYVRLCLSPESFQGGAHHFH